MFKLLDSEPSTVSTLQNLFNGHICTGGVSAHANNFQLLTLIPPVATRTLLKLRTSSLLHSLPAVTLGSLLLAVYKCGNYSKVQRSHSVLKVTADKGDTKELILSFKMVLVAKRGIELGVKNTQTHPLWPLNMDPVLQGGDGTGL